MPLKGSGRATRRVSAPRRARDTRGNSPGAPRSATTVRSLDRTPASRPGRSAGRGRSILARCPRRALRRSSRPCDDSWPGPDDMPRDVFGVAADTTDRRGRQRVEEGKPDEVEPRRVLDDPAVVDGIAVGPEHWQVDPGEVRAEPRAPDDVGHVDDGAVLQYRQAVPDADGPGHAPDA